MLAVRSLSSLGNRLNLARYSAQKTPTRFVGIDIGSRKITVATMCVEKSKSGRRNSKSLAKRWKSCHTTEIDLDPNSNPSPEWITTTIEATINGLPRCVFGENNIAVASLPLSWVHHQVVSGKDLEHSRHQCNELFRQSMFESDAHIGHWPIVGLEHGEPNEDDQFLVSATPSRGACQIAEAVSRVGYSLHSILPHGVALVESAKALTGIDPHAVAMLQIDGGCVAVSHSSGCGLFRTLPQVPVQILRDAGNRCLTLDEVRPWLSDVAAEITATIRYSERANMGGKDAPILLSGDACQIPGLDVVIAKLTNRSVARWKFNSLRRPDRRTQSSGQAIHSDTSITTEDGRYALALSLAQCAVRETIGEVAE